MILYMDRLVLTPAGGGHRERSGSRQLYYGCSIPPFPSRSRSGALLAGWLADRWASGCYPGRPPLVPHRRHHRTDHRVLGPLHVRFFLSFFESGTGLRSQDQPEDPRAFGAHPRQRHLQSAATIGSVVTPLAFCSVRFDRRGGPFLCRLLGVLWVIGWFLLFGRTTSENRDAPPSSPRLLEILARRFWILVLVVITINSTWHFFRVWMPVILRRLRLRRRGVQVQHRLLLAADAARSDSFVSLWLVRRGLSEMAATWRSSACEVCLFSPEWRCSCRASAVLWLLPLVASARWGCSRLLFLA